LATTLIESVQFVNAAPVAVTYYIFTTVTIITSAILFQDTPIGIAMAIMGFLQICAGIILLQLPKPAEDVSYTAIFKGN